MKQQFADVTGCPVNDLTKWLEKNNWKIDEAIDAYLTNKSNSFSSKRKQDAKVVAIFDKYKDSEDDSIIGIEGTLQYIEDLGFDPDNVITLVLAYFLESPSMGVFYKDKFIQIWSQLKINTIPGMKTYIEQSLYKEQFLLEESDYFKKVYDFTFEFLMENPGQKVLPYDLAIDYWRLLLLDRVGLQECGLRLQQWFDFIDSEYKRGFSQDTWRMFYLFVIEILKPDPETLKDYDEMSAWPSAIDEYIEYLRENDLFNT